MIKKSLLLLPLLSFSFLCAQENPANTQATFVDNTHEIISDYVYDASDSIDNVLSGNFFKEKEEARMNPLYYGEDSIDAFFQTEKFKNETSQAYIRMRAEWLVQSKTNDSTDITVRAHIPLSKTKYTIKNFFKNSDTNTTSNNEENDGIFEFNSKYSIGASSFHPYIKARYFINYSVGEWLIQPAQTFRYSAKDKFDETTDLYFDRPLSKEQLFRFQTSRHTQQDYSGMDYTIALQYFQTLQHKDAISFTQSFWGNTKYKYQITDATYGGISNYSTSVNYRQNIWKKWFFYDITSGVNFHRMYDYKPNYTTMFSVDIYFGRTYIR